MTAVFTFHAALTLLLGVILSSSTLGFVPIQTLPVIHATSSPPAPPVSAFYDRSMPPTVLARPRIDPRDNGARGTTITTTTTSLHVLLDVPDHFFAFTFPMLGILLSVSKGFARLRMEERAWEQRLEEARLRRLEEDPTLSELELRKQEAALEWSAYGKPRMDEERALQEEKRKTEQEEADYNLDEGGRRGRRSSRGGVQVMEREAIGVDEKDTDDDRVHHMTDEEINRFEIEYNVEYDPYYDDPYSEDELPEDMEYELDRKYGDRFYSNGEVFYKDKASGLYYRQGAKPRDLSFW